MRHFSVEKNFLTIISNFNKGKMVMVSNRVGIVKTVRAGKTVDKYVILNPDGTIQKQIKRRYRWLTERCKNFIKTKMSEK